MARTSQRASVPASEYGVWTDRAGRDGGVVFHRVDPLRPGRGFAVADVGIGGLRAETPALTRVPLQWSVAPGACRRAGWRPRRHRRPRLQLEAHDGPTVVTVGARSRCERRPSGPVLHGADGGADRPCLRGQRSGPAGACRLDQPPRAALAGPGLPRVLRSTGSGPHGRAVRPARMRAVRSRASCPSGAAPPPHWR
jgi:hypothetical protein